MSSTEYSFTLNVELVKNPGSIKVTVRREELRRLIDGSTQALRRRNKTLEFIFMPSRDNPERWQALVTEKAI